MDINDFGRISLVTWTTGLKERIKKAEKEMQMKPYRAIPIGGKDFVYGWPFERGGGSYIIPITDNYHTPASFVLTFVPVIPETVGQFIGLKDKNGKDVFVGDKNIRHDNYAQAGTIIFDKQDLQYKVHFPLTNHKAHIRLNNQLEKAENIELIEDKEDD